jgi:hypothetical protein
MNMKTCIHHAVSVTVKAPTAFGPNEKAQSSHNFFTTDIVVMTEDGSEITLTLFHYAPLTVEVPEPEQEKHPLEQLEALCTIRR